MYHICLCVLFFYVEGITYGTFILNHMKGQRKGTKGLRQFKHMASNNFKISREKVKLDTKQTWSVRNPKCVIKSEILKTDRIKEK